MNHTAGDAPTVEHLRVLFHVDLRVDRHFFFSQGDGQVLSEPLLELPRPIILGQFVLGAPLIFLTISGDTGIENLWDTSFARSSAAFFDPSSADSWFPLAIIPRSSFSLSVSLISFLKQYSIPFFDEALQHCKLLLAVQDETFGLEKNWR